MARQHPKNQRPGLAGSFDSRAKMHLREVATRRGVYRVLSLRPGTDPPDEVARAEAIARRLRAHGSQRAR